MGYVKRKATTKTNIAIGLPLFSVRVNKGEAELMCCSAEISRGSAAQYFTCSKNAEIF